MVLLEAQRCGFGAVPRTRRSVRLGERGSEVPIGILESPDVEPLFAALTDHDATVRHEAVRALGATGDRRAVEPLIAALDDSDDRVRFLAAIALGNIGDPTAVPPLIGALGAGSDDLRRFAAAALGKIGDPQAVDPLTTALEDHDVMVRRCATEALRLLGHDPEATAKQRKKTEVLQRAQAWWAGKPDQGDDLYACDACGRRIDERAGTSLLGSYMRCPNCTQRVFSRWDEKGLD